MVDESKINPNLDKLYEHFSTVLEHYFEDGKPIDKYFEEVSCYNCGSKEISSSFIVNKFRHVRCKNCNMVYVTPRLKETITHDLYNEKPYTEFYKIKLIPSVDYRKNVLGVRKYEQINKHFKKPGKVLDIGCGIGEVLSVFKDNNWDCTGIEFNEFAADYAQKNFGLNIINKSIYDFDGTEQYDLIMLWGVLEHFYDPSKVLRKIHELLKDDGILLLEVPSADSVLVRYYEKTSKMVDRIIEGDRHIMLFSVRGFLEMTEKAGFAPIDVKSNGLDISTLNRLELDKKLDNSLTNELQLMLDNSLQGDLLRGFFKKK